MGVEAAIMAGIGLLGAGASAYSADKQAKAQKSAQRKAQEQMEKQAKSADEANNRVNQRKPNVAGALLAAQSGGRQGLSGTMLTGPQGVDQSTLVLGRNTLLGQ